MKLFQNSKLTKQKGFTLLELLLVIVVVSLLAFVLYPRLVAGPINARDADRKQDLAKIKNALEHYYQENGSYPAQLTSIVEGATPYLKPPLPTDPKTKVLYVYTPIGNPATSYVLSATLENKKDKDIKKGTVELYEVQSAN